MKEINQSQVNQTVFDKISGIIHLKLLKFFLEFNPDKDAASFEELVLKPMKANAEKDIGAELIKIYEDLRLTGQPTDYKFSPLFIACGYFAQAERAMKESDREQAWSYMTDANYWCGVLFASQGIEVARDQTIISTRKKTAADGGKARYQKKYGKLIEEAYRLAKDECPKGKGWQSRSQAARTITPKMLEFSINQKEPLSVLQAEKTINEWLKDMPESVKYFPKKNGAPIK